MATLENKRTNTYILSEKRQRRVKVKASDCVYTQHTYTRAYKRCERKPVFRPHLLRGECLGTCD